MLIDVKTHKTHELRTCVAHYRDNDMPVQPGAAITPTQMYEMSKKGQAVSVQNASSNLFVEGVPNPSFEVPAMYKRGMDMASLWEAQHAARKAVSRAANESVVDNSVD